jgi:integrase
MALLQECPKCKERLSLDYWEVVREGELVKKVKRVRDRCPSCGFKLKKASGKAYWIEYYINGRRKRERIGPNKNAADQRLREVLKLRTEERFIDKDPAARLTLGELSLWYRSLPEVKAKDSYSRDKQCLDNLERLLGESTKLKNITAGRMESYQKERLNESSSTHKGENIRPATVNMEVMILKVAINRAIKHGRLQFNQISRVKKLQENNVRQRVLTQEEFDTLLNNCDPHIRGPVMVGYYMGLRLSEIINLTWPEVDLKRGFVRLAAERTKTNTSRSIPLHPKVKAMLETLPRGLHTDRVFLFDGKPFNEFKRSWKTALKNAGIEDFVFHDLRHCALNNLRKAGNDFFQVMALSGHKTMSVFKRYNLVTEEELAGIKWPKEEKKVEGKRKEG